ncbi:RNA-guided endonuclease InsQ/TnpB family protein [Glycomyces tenuis]|uniref:RNA-guided endonuclease InsQ/TnpB family protein n=1 Tax=Glycomyces tenuis TaxID=58116 RepID=UPI000B0B4BB7|nr:RNA-guided endonuclease TnpB family protein [Glycomyces tenuis]
MLLRYRFRLYPTGPQRAALARNFGCARVVFNDAVAARRRAHAEGMPYPATAVLSKSLITEAKQAPERAWLGEVSTVVLQQALADCDRAWKNFFDSVGGKRAGVRMGPPRFKKRTAVQAIRFTRNARFRVLESGRLRLPKIGDVKVAWSRELPSEPTSVTVAKTATGKYYASFVVSLDGDETLGPVEAECGIDLGLNDFAVLSNGRVIENPRFFRKLERKLKKAQRVLARKTKGSANRAKARAKVARVHEKAKHQRDDWVNQQVAKIVAESQGIYIEDLSVKGLARGRGAKSIHDAALGMFSARLESKAARAGRSFVKVDRFFPSTRLCSTCGVLAGPKGLDGLRVREWRCECGAVHDRDRNAAVNILREGRRVAAGQADTVNASGGQVRPGMPGTARNTRVAGQNEEPTRTRLVSTSR